MKLAISFLLTLGAFAVWAWDCGAPWAEALACSGTLLVAWLPGALETGSKVGSLPRVVCEHRITALLIRAGDTVLWRVACISMIACAAVICLKAENGRFITLGGGFAVVGAVEVLCLYLKVRHRHDSIEQHFP